MQAGAIPMPQAGSFRQPAPLRRSERRSWASRTLTLARTPGLGSGLAIALLTGAALFGAVRGGQYQSFLAEQGSPANIVARALGFGIDAITISGARELSVNEVLKGAGVDPRDSLLFLNAAEVRDRLLAMPLVKDAKVHKLFPNRLVVSVTERAPFALWQKDGEVSVISADGTAIDKLRDQRFDDQPFVVGDGANQHVAEFMRLLDDAGPLRPLIRAGVYIGERRWNLNMKSGLEVRLPEIGADQAVAEFARLADSSRLLDKDLLSVDLRMSGRLVVRISEEAAAARTKALAHKRGKGGAT